MLFRSGLKLLSVLPGVLDFNVQPFTAWCACVVISCKNLDAFSASASTSLSDSTTSSNMVGLRLQILWERLVLEQRDPHPAVRTRVEMAGPEKGQFAAQNINRQHIGGQQVVVDFGVRVTRRLLHPPRHKTVFGMCQQKAGQGLICGPLRQRAVKVCHHARGANGQFQRRAILVKAFAQTGFQLFFRNIPEAGGLRALVKVDREKAGRLGVSMQAVNDTLNDAFGQRQISTIFGQANQYRVILEADPAWQADPSKLLLLRVPGLGVKAVQRIVQSRRARRSSC